MGIASSTLIPEDVLDCLLLILLTAILHPRTTHLNCPDFLLPYGKKPRIHSVSLNAGMVSLNRNIP